MFEAIASESAEWIVPVAGALVSALMLYSYLRLPAETFGPNQRAWNHVRRAFLPALDRVLQKRGLFAAYELGHAEYVGRIHRDLDDVEHVLYQQGFKRQPLAALKTAPDGRLEDGSWAYRERPLAPKQVHVMLFRAPAEDAVDVYAHREFSAIHPLVAAKHYRGVEYSPREGIEWTVGKLWGEFGQDVFVLSDRARDVLGDLPEPEREAGE